MRAAKTPRKWYVPKPQRVANLPARSQRAGGQVPRAQSSKKGTDAAAAACMVLPSARLVRDAQLRMPGPPGPAPSARAPRLASAAPSQPRPVLRRPWRCSLRRGAASVLHCAPRALPLAGGASECCIGRLAVAKWFLAPPTSSHGKGSGERGALGRERAPGALAPRARARARAGESAGKCSSRSASRRSAPRCGLSRRRDHGRQEWGKGQKRGHRWQASWAPKYSNCAAARASIPSLCESAKNRNNVFHRFSNYLNYQKGITPSRVRGKLFIEDLLCVRWLTKQGDTVMNHMSVRGTCSQI